MKTNKPTDYLAPQVEVVNVLAGGVLCESANPLGFGINNMEIISGGAETDWDWE